MIRRISIQAFVVTGLMLLIAGQSYAVQAGAPIRRCPPARAHTLRSDRQAVVYKIREPGIETLESEHYRVYSIGIRGCARGHMRSYKLGGPSVDNGSAGGESSSGTNNVALGGTMVAFEESVRGCGLNHSECSGKFIVVVRNLRTGKVVHKVPTGTLATPDPNFVGVGATTAVVVKGDGAVAWITEAPIAEGIYQVHVLDRTGSRLLASGGDIKPYALGLKGSELYWSQGGKRMSTVLN